MAAKIFNSPVGLNVFKLSQKTACLRDALGTRTCFKLCSTINSKFYRKKTYLLPATCNNDFTTLAYRYLSTHSPNKKYDIDTLLETWTYEVSPRGSITTILPFNTVIKPLPPQDYPYMNKVILALYYDPKDNVETPNSYKLGELADIYELKVKFDEDKANMNIGCDLLSGVSLPITCIIQVPINAQLDVKMLEKCDVSVEKMESNNLSVTTDAGNCYFRSIKCLDANVVSKSGSIISKSTFLGNLIFHTGNYGSIRADKLQGSTIQCVTDSGIIDIRSLYSSETSLESNSGDLLLGNIHGNISMKGQKSNIRIESLEGDLNVSLQSGNCDAHLSQHKHANIEIANGNANLSFTENVKTNLCLSCDHVKIDEKFNALQEKKSNHWEGYIGEKGVSQTNISTRCGSVYIKMLDWIQTTKLAILMKRETETE